MKVLQVVEHAFRTIVEEQDDAILWLTQSMVGAGASLEVLLTGHSAYYAVQQNRQPTLALGDWRQTQPAEVPKDLSRLVEKGVPVYVVREDLEERGLSHLPVQAGVEVINRDALPVLYGQVDQVWQW